MQLFLNEAEIKTIKRALDSFTNKIASDRTNFGSGEIDLVIDEQVADADKLKLYMDSLLPKAKI